MLAVAVVGVVAVGAVECLYQHEAAESAGSMADCVLEEYPSTSVTVRAAVEVDDVDYPRVSSDVVIRVPRTWGRAQDLLGDPDHGAYRAAIRCLLGVYSTDFPVYRDGPPSVTVSGGEVVVHDHVWTELVKAGRGAVGVLDLTIEPDQPWRMAVVSRGGLSHSTSWTVTIAAPQNWLDSAVPQPWPPYAAGPGELTWFYGVTSPTDEGVELAAADLTPDARAVAFVWQGSIAGDLFLRCTAASSAAAFLVIVLIFIRRIRKQLPHRDTPLVRRAWSVTVPLLVLQAVGLGIDITRVVLGAQGDRVPDWSTAAWGVDIAVGVTILVVAHCFGVGRKPRVAALQAFAASLAIGWLLADTVAFTTTQRADYALILRLSENVMVFAITLIAGAATIQAVRSIARSAGKRPKRVWWTWPIASVAAGGLLVERAWTALRNDFLQQWMYDPQPLADAVRNAPRYTLWWMPANWLWIFDLVPAIAVFVLSRSYLRDSSTPDHRMLTIISLTLLVLGPAQWSVAVYGFDLPTWLLVAAAFLLFHRIGRPVLDRELRSGEKIRDFVASRGDAAVRLAAIRWLKRSTQPSGVPCHPDLPKRVTPVDVVLAMGPGGSPGENMTIVVKIALWLGVPVGLAVYLSRQVARLDFTAGLPDSVFLGYFINFSWEVAKWVFAAAVLGVLWQYLPGKRGPVKVLPLVLAYSVGAVCEFMVPMVVGGTVEIDGLIDAGVFAIDLMFLGLAMDIRTLRNLDVARYFTFKEGLSVYGVSNLPSRITAALAPVSAVIAVVFTIIAGPQSDSKPELPQSPDTVQNKPNAAIR
ncbi:DUF6185 family protein [Amycolatopsis sp. NPDC098790]|uniref:DUF6185 family protein n=1 Tax=Amycolatopsis sp. NPDC098790 TaxID=3363939 RepID=UPI0037F5CCE8